MQSFKWDPHVHTTEVSPCGKVPAAEMVRMYQDAGYSGVCVTDHYYDGFFNRCGDIPWNDKIDRYTAGYHAAREEGEKIGFRVLFGQEMRFIGSNNDYLAFGFTPEELKQYPELYTITLHEYTAFARKNGVAVFQAHPFRGGLTRANPDDLDGAEVYNGHPGHDSHNDEALLFAKTHRLRELSGSDFHQRHHLARGGIFINRIPESSRDFARMILTDGIVSLIKTEE